MRARTNATVSRINNRWIMQQAQYAVAILYRRIEPIGGQIKIQRYRRQYPRADFIHFGIEQLKRFFELGHVRPDIGQH